jgi:uncharacterized protein (TIGR00730 family)
MQIPPQRSDKAYRDREFLNSRDARTIRILSEYLQPQQRFLEEGIDSTIVFFGSARIKDPEEAGRILAKAKESGDDQQILSAERGQEISKYYQDAVTLARMLTEWSNGRAEGNRFAVCSGGGPGIMEAANRGASEAGGPSVGLNISLPFEQFPNPYISDGLSFEFHYFFMRKLWFAYLAKAIVILPGGFGTMDEMMEVLTLIQTKKVDRPMPMVLYGSVFWNDVLNLDKLAEWGVISPEDLDLFEFIDTPEEAFAYLSKQLDTHYSS